MYKRQRFIHCLWIYPNENKNKGLGTQLIEECIEDARQNNCNGVTVVTSKNAFMANSWLKKSKNRMWPKS
ncbi:MAG: GNAT family N-acetyltransferase [Bacteroidales bacterium]